MKKLLIFLLPIFIFFHFSSVVHGLEPFVPYPGNPIHIDSSYPDWQEKMAYQQFVIYENGVFKMWYTSINANPNSSGVLSKIGYATSMDGITWISNKLLDTGIYKQVHSPSMITYDTKQYLLYEDNEEYGKFIIQELSPQMDLVNGTARVVYIGNGSKEKYIDDPTLHKIGNGYFLLYTNNDGYHWHINLATFDSTFTIAACQNNPIFDDVEVAAPTMNEINGLIYILFHKNGSIYETHTPFPLTCSSVFSDYQLLQQVNVFYPSLVMKDSSLYLYSNVLVGDMFNIHLSIASLTSTAPLKPIIIVPGMFSTWNKDAILHNATAPYAGWVINPIVHEYDGIIKTLQNVGYELGKNLYVFAYDWRKSTISTAQDLNSYIESLPGNQTYSLVGHSLGGLVIRAYLNAFGTDKINQVITAGTPHRGTPQAYKAIEGGEIDGDDTSVWLMQKLVLMLYRTGLETDKQILNDHVPVLSELLPLYDYLTDAQHQAIPTSAMRIRNTVLPTLEQHSDIIKSVFSNHTQTPGGYQVQTRSPLDGLLDLYPDGRPVSVTRLPGDGVVPAVSSSWGTAPINLPLDHGPLIYNKAAIKSILTELGIDASDDQIVEGTGTVISPSLLFVILSPATIEINHNGVVYKETNGIIHIPNPDNNPYTVQVTATGPGDYRLLAGLFADGEDAWTDVSGHMNDVGQIETHTLAISGQPLFDSGNPQLLLTDFISDVERYWNATRSKTLQQALAEAKKAQKAYASNKKNEFKTRLLQVNSFLISSLQDRKVRSTVDMISLVSKTVRIYALLVPSARNPITEKKLVIEARILTESTGIIEKSLKSLKKNRYEVKDAAMILSWTNEILRDAKTAPMNEASRKQILLASALQMIKIIGSLVKRQ